MPNWMVHLEGGPRRVNHAAVAIGDHVYTFGGYCSGAVIDQSDALDVHVLDSVTNRWQLIRHCNTELAINSRVDASSEQRRQRRPIEVGRDVPTQRYGHTAVSYNGKAYIWGGRNDDYGASNMLYEFDPVSHTWSLVKVLGNFSPPARDGHTAVMDGDRMYIFGGFEEDLQRFSQETFFFDFSDSSWYQVVTINEPPCWRDFHTASIINGVMYIFGGRSDQSGQVGDDYLFHSTQDVYDDSLMALNLKTKEWKKVEATGTKPGGRRSHSVFVHNSKMYMFGGYLGTKNIHYNELYCFEPATSNWSITQCHGEYPTPRRRHCTVVIGDKVFLFGGTMPNNAKCVLDSSLSNSSAGLSDLSDLHVLDFAPTLKNLALMAVIGSCAFKMDTKSFIANDEVPVDLKYDLLCASTPNRIQAGRHDTSG